MLFFLSVREDLEAEVLTTRPHASSYNNDNMSILNSNSWIMKHIWMQS